MKKLYHITQQGQMSGCLADVFSRPIVNSKVLTALMRRFAWTLHFAYKSPFRMTQLKYKQYIFIVVKVWQFNISYEAIQNIHVELIFYLTHSDR